MQLRKSGRYVLKFLTLTIISLLVSNQSYSQFNTIHIGGQVSDSLTGAGINNVTIYITNVMTAQTDSTHTNASGFWAFDLSFTSAERSSAFPEEFSVSQNYPNPFNPSTKINLNIPERGSVKVQIVNAIGEIIDSYEEYLEKGSYSIQWNAKGSAGVYFINVRAGNRSITRKMILTDRASGTGLTRFRQENSVTSSISRQPISHQNTNSIIISLSKFGYMPYAEKANISGGEYFNHKLETIHSNSILADLHNDILEKMAADSTYHLADHHTNNHTDIPRLKAGGVDLQLFAVWVDPVKYAGNSYNQAEKMIGIFKSELNKNRESMGQAHTKAEALSLNKDHKIAAIMAVEGGHTIENDLEKLKNLYKYGMRYFTLTWNNSTNWAISAQDSLSETTGLSEFGKQVIRTLDSLGVIIDVSHTGIKTIKDVLSLTKNPIIASHSGARALRNHYRNLYDYQIKDIASSGGVIGVVFYPPFLSAGNTNITTVVNHIDYIVKVAGIDHVAIGSDFDGIERTVTGLENVTKFPELTLELLRRGYSITEIRKILGENFLRVFEKVCGK